MAAASKDAPCPPASAGAILWGGSVKRQDGLSPAAAAYGCVRGIEQVPAVFGALLSHVALSTTAEHAGQLAHLAAAAAGSTVAQLIFDVPTAQAAGAAARAIQRFECDRVTMLGRTGGNTSTRSLAAVFVECIIEEISQRSSRGGQQGNSISR